MKEEKNMRPNEYNLMDCCGKVIRTYLSRSSFSTGLGISFGLLLIACGIEKTPAMIFLTVAAAWSAMLLGQNLLNFLLYPHVDDADLLPDARRVHLFSTILIAAALHIIFVGIILSCGISLIPFFPLLFCLFVFLLKEAFQFSASAWDLLLPILAVFVLGVIFQEAIFSKEDEILALMNGVWAILYSESYFISFILLVLGLGIMSALRKEALYPTHGMIEEVLTLKLDENPIEIEKVFKREVDRTDDSRTKELFDTREPLGNDLWKRIAHRRFGSYASEDGPAIVSDIIKQTIYQRMFLHVWDVFEAIAMIS